MGYESERVAGYDHDARHGDHMNDKQLATLAQLQAFLDSKCHWGQRQLFTRIIHAQCPCLVHKAPSSN